MNYLDFVSDANSQFADLRNRCKNFLEVETTRMKISDQRSSRGRRQWKIHLLEEGIPDQEDNVNPCDIAWFRAMRLIFSGQCSKVELENRLLKLGCKNPGDIVEKLKEKYDEDNLKYGMRADVEDKVSSLNRNDGFVFQEEKTMVELFSFMEQKFPTPKGVSIHGIATGLIRVEDLEKQIESVNGGVPLRDRTRGLLRQSHGPNDEIEVIGGSLGFYVPSTERLFLVLPAIYNQAKRSPFINPIELFEKVLIHEMAHCIHHIGIDSNDRIWSDFSSAKYGVDVIEGLANYHTYQYFRVQRKWMSIAGMIWLSNRQPPQYAIWKKWLHFRLENINRMLLELRNPKNKYLGSPYSIFFNELQNNHNLTIA